MNYNDFLIEDKINSALRIMSVEQRLNFYELALNGESEKAYNYLMECVFSIATKELKEIDEQAYKQMMSEE